MRLKKLEIDGFKSYANRAVITDFDNSFNAITGYNGTGKSNVLDAICFVLGIANIKQVRATHLADLIFKQGQAGISKASVTATFEHNDKNHRVPGFELGKDIVVRRQVILNGRNTYTVNGSNATNNKIADMFRSVGMNVNNPHFLIMQGRIGKVLNMTPKEILAMVEEAVGVRIYECRKTTCLRLIEKKDIKMKEISAILDDNIRPMIDRLTAEREQYLKYERLLIEIGKLNKRLLAYEYIQMENGIEGYLEYAAEKDNQVAEIKDEIKNAQARIDEIVVEKDQLTKLKESSTGREKELIDAKLKVVQAACVQKESVLDEAKGDIRREQEDIKSLTKSKEKSEKELGKLQLKFQTIEKTIGNDVKIMEEAQVELEKAQRDLAACQRNMMTDENGQEILPNELKMRFSAKLTASKTKLREAKQRLTQLDTQIKNLEREIASKKDMGSNNLGAEKEKLLQKIEKLQTDLRTIDFDEGQEGELNAQIQEATMAHRRLNNETQRFFDNYNHMRFNYDEPPVQFDRRDVYGQLFKLFRVKDKKYHRAIEIAAGGNLWNVVTRTAQLAQDLLHHKCLKQRTTFAPLDSVSGRWIPDNEIQQIRQKCKGEVFSVADIIEFEPHLENAMKYAFGGRLICQDREDASIIAFTFHIRAITLIGEDVNPSGTASGGGGSAKDSKVMQDIESYNSKLVEKNEAEERLENLKREQRKLQEKSQKHHQINEELLQTKQRLQSIENQLKQSVTHMLEDDLAKFQTEKDEKTQIINECAAEMPDLEKRVDELEMNIKNQEKFMKAKKTEAEKLVASAKRKLEECNASNKKEELDKMKEDIANLQESIEHTEKEIQSKQEQINQLETQLKGLQAEFDKAKDAVEREDVIRTEYLAKLDAHDNEIRLKNQESAAIKKQILELESRKDTVSRAAAAERQKSKACKEKVAQMEKANPYLKQDKKFFNTANSDYDFTNFNYENAKALRDEKVAEKTEISQNINPQAGKLLESNEEQANDLMKKREIIEKDRAQLHTTIANLDEKKRQEMKTAYENVNESFGAIFSTLLPGAQAKLVPTHGATIDNLDNGLEFKVGFNNLWKESLSELSGGQKSLVALSLILSLLRFKPAPLYILDEIDAALDISHTSNIGVLIKKHFSNAQFIVVSLKPGMFKNANAIFRTRLAEGVSSISRVQDDIAEDFEKENQK